MKQRKSDILWKAILEEVFDDALRFIYPDAEFEYDLDRGFVFLDKELAELYPEPDKKSATRHADKMVRVYSRKGKENWILMHIEIQGDTSDRKAFSERMFRYFYRILDKHCRPVSAVAIFIGPDGSRMPNTYCYKYRETKLTYTYHTLVIQEHQEEELLRSGNPFAFVLLTVKTSLLEGNIPEWELLEKKVLIANDLLTRPFPKRKIGAIFSFLKSYVLFEEPEMNRIFNERTESLEKATTMNMTDFVRMEAREEGLEEGLKKGRNEEREKIARRLLTDTELSIEKIAELAEVPLTQVEELSRVVRGK
jgi:hypothetical protein